MTTKNLSKKQVIISIGNENNVKFIKDSVIHVTNINRNFRNTKSEVLVDFIQSDPLGVIIITNKVSLPSNLLIIKNYVKNAENIDSSQVDSLCLPQSKSYLKIIGILYFLHGNMQDRLTLSDIELVIKQNHIFNNISLTSKPRVIKASPKLDMAIIWINIWNTQSGARAKDLINRCFNVRRYIITIREANINSGILQCKNCWKWDHSTFSYRIQGSKCIKYNGPHKLENY